jgi:hypothetical protein
MRGIYLFFPSAEWCPKGGVGVKNTPHKSEFVTPLVVGNLPLIRLSEGCPKGGVGVKKPPRHIRICHPSCRGEFTSFFPRRGGAYRARLDKETTPTYQNMSPLYRGESTSYSPRREEFTSYSPQRGVPEGRGGRENSPRYVLEC